MLDIKKWISKVTNWIKGTDTTLTQKSFHMPFCHYRSYCSTATADSNRSDTGTWHYPGNFTGTTYTHTNMAFGYGFFAADQNGFRVLKKGIYRLSVATHFNDASGACSHAVRFYNYTASSQIGLAVFATNTTGYASVCNTWTGFINAGQTITVQAERYSTGASGSKWKLTTAEFTIELVQDLETYDPTA